MGRPSVGQRAMTSADRQCRFLARIREKAAAVATAPTPNTPGATDGHAIRVAHLALDPVRTARWLCQKLGDRAQAFGEAYNEALADRTRVSGMEAEGEP